MKRFLLKGIRGITEEGNTESYEVDSEVSVSKTSIHDKSLDNQLADSAKDTSNQEASVALDKETTEVLLFVPCVLVTPKKKLAGHLAIMRNVLHFFGEHLVDGTGGSSVFSSFSSPNTTKHDQLLGARKNKSQKPHVLPDGDDDKVNIANNLESFSEASVKKQQRKIKRHRRWSVFKIKAVYWTRYLLRYTAIEVFFNDSVAPVFLNFPSSKDAKDVGTLIVSSRNEALLPKASTRDRNGVIAFVDRRVALEMAETARESWRRREITNFEYLMILNTLAGRSSNDLTQYPIFPWVLADYSSEQLDSNKSSTFRDLSKPIEALDSKRYELLLWVSLF